MKVQLEAYKHKTFFISAPSKEEFCKQIDSLKDELYQSSLDHYYDIRAEYSNILIFKTDEGPVVTQDVTLFSPIDVELEF